MNELLRELAGDLLEILDRAGLDEPEMRARCDEALSDEPHEHQCPVNDCAHG